MKTAIGPSCWDGVAQWPKN